MSTRVNILLVDDDVDIVEFIEYNLNKEGYMVRTCHNGKDALEITKTFTPHLILLDVMMPGMDGVEVCEELRKNPELDLTIIAFLTARGEDYSQIAGFEAGADDYITKPIKPKLLMSRVKALLKRFNSSSNSENIIEIGDLIIDRNSYSIKLGNEIKSLPKKEFEILSLLATDLGKVFTREQIFLKVWGADVIVGDRTIDVHIRKLRETIGSRRIQTVKGVGYKII